MAPAVNAVDLLRVARVVRIHGLRPGYASSNFFFKHVPAVACKGKKLLTCHLEEGVFEKGGWFSYRVTC